MDDEEDNLQIITSNSTNEDITELMFAVVTSVILGLMILITVIGK